jgi:addiction module HigA family antidote
MLKDELEARGLSPHALAIALGLPAPRISQIVRGQRAITPETALRLARYLGGSAAIWLRRSRRGHPSRRLKRTGQRFALGPLGASSSAPSTPPVLELKFCHPPANIKKSVAGWHRN